MAFGAGPGGFGGGPGGFGGGHGGPGGHGFGPGGFHGGPFGLHSGGPPGFIGRGGYSQGHYSSRDADTDQSHAEPKKPLINSDTYGPQSKSSTHPKRSQSQKPNRKTDNREIHEGADKGISPLLTRPSVRYNAITMAILSLILGCSMCMSNILATKVWAIGPIVLDGGFILFPLTYAITDILVELYYRRAADLIVICCCLTNLVAFFALKLTAILPPAPGVMHVEPSQVLGLSSRIMIASAIGVIASTLVNNYIYDRMRRYKSAHAVSEQAIRRRAWVSSFFAHIPDSALFTFLAFSGYSPLPALAHQFLTSYLAGLAVETLMLPFTARIAHSLRQYLTHIPD